MTTTDPETGPTPATMRPQLRALRKAGDFTAALALLEQPHPDLAPGFIRLERARTLHQAGRDAEALAELDHDETSGAAAALLRVRSLIALGRPEDAERALGDMALPANKKTALLFLSLARAFFSLGQFEKAAEFTTHAQATGVSVAAARKMELQCWMLTGQKTRLRSALTARGADAAPDMFHATRKAVARLNAPDLSANRQTLLNNVLECTEAVLDFTGSPPDIRQLRSALRKISHDERRATVKKALAHQHSAILDQAPTSIRDLSPEASAGTGSSPVMQRKISGVAQWLDIADADWPRQVRAGLEYKHRLGDLVTHSAPHREEMNAALPRLDWSEVHACRDSGQPVLLVGLHSHFRPAMLTEFVRSGLGVKLVTTSWVRLHDPELDALFFTPDLPTPPESELQSPPTDPEPESGLEPFSTTEIMRNLLRHLGAGGVAALAADGHRGEGIRKFTIQGMRVSLPQPQWALARRTGAAVFWMDADWRDGQLACRLTRWEIPDGSDPQAEEALWYDQMISAWRVSCLQDPRNVLPAPWIRGVEETPPT